MLDNAIQEATRLASSLRSIDQSGSHSAEAVRDTLQSSPDDNALLACAATLEAISDSLPAGTLAGLIRIRLARLQGIVNALIDTDTTPPAA
ncbi:Flagellar protein FliT [Halomonas sp. NYA30]